MASPSQKSSRKDVTPFLLQLFYRNGSFHRPEEFAADSLPSHVTVYTWLDCTLNELALELANAMPSAIPSPAIGTRLAFQLVFPDLRNTSAVTNAPPRFAVKDMGSIVIGEAGAQVEQPVGANRVHARASDNNHKTLSEARFVVGDYVSCAVLPPLSDGSVAPASSIRREPAMMPREGRGGKRGGFQARDDGMARGGHRGGRGGWRDNSGGGMPIGDWKRGEMVPDAAGGRSRGRGRW